VAVAGSASAGQTPLPGGEERPEDAASGEDTSGRLANGPVRGATAPHLLREVPTAGADPTATTELVRTTGRIRVDFRLLPPDEAKALRKDLRIAQELQARVANVISREMWKRDAANLDPILLEGRRPVRGEWKVKDLGISQSEAYRMGCRSAPELPPCHVSAVTKRVWTKWRRDRWEALVRMDKSPAHYKRTDPIVLRAAEVGFKISETAKNTVEVRFALLREGPGKPRYHTIPIQLRDRYQRRVLCALARGEWKHGDLLVKETKGRWYLHIPYKKRVERATGGGSVCAINRGIRYFLVGVTDGGRTWRYPGNEIVQYLRQMQRRRRSYQNDSRASGRRGRGRRRILQPTERLRGKAARWRNTKNWQLANNFVRWCAEHEVTTIVVEDFSGIRHWKGIDRIGYDIWKLVQEWPFYQLMLAISSVAESYGIKVMKVPAHYISQKCPSCGHTDEKNMNLRRWLFVCQGCGYERHLDVTAAMNALDKERLGEATELGGRE